MAFAAGFLVGAFVGAAVTAAALIADAYRTVQRVNRC